MKNQESLYKKEFEYGGAEYRVVRRDDVCTCERIDHGTGRGRLVDFDTEFVRDQVSMQSN